MADLPQTEPSPDLRAADESDPSWLQYDIARSRMRTVLPMIPVSIFSGFVSTVAMSVISHATARMFHLGRREVLPRNLILMIGLVSFVLTMLYFVIQLDKGFTKARLRGELRIDRIANCSSCGAGLIFGRMICECCGADLRADQSFNLTTRRLRRQVLYTHVLGTVPLANLAFAVTALAVGAVWDFMDLTAVTIAFVATGLVVTRRIPRAIELWRLVSAEEVESRVESK